MESIAYAETVGLACIMSRLHRLLLHVRVSVPDRKIHWNHHRFGDFTLMNMKKLVDKHRSYAPNITLVQCSVKYLSILFPEDFAMKL